MTVVAKHFALLGHLILNFSDLKTGLVSDAFFDLFLTLPPTNLPSRDVVYP